MKDFIGKIESLDELKFKAVSEKKPHGCQSLVVTLFGISKDHVPHLKVDTPIKFKLVGAGVYYKKGKSNTWTFLKTTVSVPENPLIFNEQLELAVRVAKEITKPDFELGEYRSDCGEYAIYVAQKLLKRGDPSLAESNTGTKISTRSGVVYVSMRVVAGWPRPSVLFWILWCWFRNPPTSVNPEHDTEADMRTMRYVLDTDLMKKSDVVAAIELQLKRPDTEHDKNRIALAKSYLELRNPLDGEEYYIADDEAEERTPHEKLVKSMLTNYSQIIDMGRIYARFPKEDFDQLIEGGKIDPGARIPLPDGSSTNALEFLEAFNNSVDQSLVCSAGFKNKVDPLLLRVVKKRNWALSDEQILIEEFLKDIAEKAAMMVAFKKSMDSIIEALIDVKKTKAQGNPKPPTSLIKWLVKWWRSWKLF